MSKRGIEIQFTWIFVLIIGIMLFGFFMNIIGNMRAGSEQAGSARVKSQIESILRVVESSPNSFNTYDIPNTKITFECIEPESSGFMTGAKASLANSVVFSPEVLSGNTLSTYALDWKLPYRAGTFVYLASKRVNFIFLKKDVTVCSSYIDWLIEDFPKGLNYEVIGETDLDTKLVDKGYDINIVVQIGTVNGVDCKVLTYAPPNNIDNKVKLESHQNGGVYKGRQAVSLVTIIPDDVNKNFGEVHFYKRKGYDRNNGDSYYYRKEMLLGAVFSGQKDMYECNILKAFQRAKMVSELNYRRVWEIDNNAKTTGQIMHDARPWCQTLYAPIMNVFTNNDYPYCGNIKIMGEILKKIVDHSYDVPDACSDARIQHCNNPCGSNEFQRMDDNYNRLVRDALDISRRGNCPYVY